MRGKRKKRDVQAFDRNLADNILELRRDLFGGTYRHGSYHRFIISDPKPRVISKASVRDRLVHHAVHLVLLPFFDRRFIADSFSCRRGKGTHAALNRFRAFGRKVGRNGTRTCWVLKCDIRKFFASIDHGVLIELLAERITDSDAMRLLKEMISSYHTPDVLGRGLPLGNVTSQLFANAYLNALDQFVKHRLRVRHYVRYADDFVVLSQSKRELEDVLPRIADFLANTLRLTLHPDKISITTLASGVDFLGWVHFPDHRVLRSATRRRAMRRIAASPTEATLHSYLGLFAHGNAATLSKEAQNLFWLHGGGA